MSTDNSPAHWAFALACGAGKPTLDELRASIDADAVPVAMILKTAERGVARFRHTLSQCPSPNAAGWKVGHLASVGLHARGLLEGQPLALLQAHFIALMDPGNMFVVPKVWGGLAELPEVIVAVRATDSGEMSG